MVRCKRHFVLRVILVLISIYCIKKSFEFHNRFDYSINKFFQHVNGFIYSINKSFRYGNRVGISYTLTNISKVVDKKSLFLKNVKANPNKRKARGKANILNDPNPSEIFGDDIDVDVYLNTRKFYKLSGLGKILFLREERPPKRNRTFKILMWKHGKDSKQPHYEDRLDHFSSCSVENCHVKYSDSSVEDADAVLVQLHGLRGIEDLRNVARSAGQRWVFIAEKSPSLTFFRPSRNWSRFAGIFDWSMTYKAESDIPIPYGRTVPLEIPIKLDDSLSFEVKFRFLVPNALKKRRDVLVAIMLSDCYADSARFQYVKELQKYMQVDFYGGCASSLSNDVCLSSYDCLPLEKYLFYLAFEDYNCNQYVSEKAFIHGYGKGAVPIIMGSKNKHILRILPPYSYLNVRDFKSPKDLAEHLWFINKTFEDSYWKFHKWRKSLEVVDEYTHSSHFCRVCEALNYNDETPKVYGIAELKAFLDPVTNCYEQ